MDKYFKFLDELRESSETNMFGAVPYMVKCFPELDKSEARDILFKWMDSKKEKAK